MQKTHTACFSGPRSEKLALGGRELRLLQEDLRAAVARAAREGYRNFFFGGATGFDVLAAEAVLALQQEEGLHLYAALPYPDFGRYFGAEWQARQRACLQKSTGQVSVSLAYAPHCYYARNNYMVKSSSLLICYYTGEKGGTRQTVQAARKEGLFIRNLCGQESML